MTVNVSVTVNGTKHDIFDVEPRLLLSDFLRDTLGLTGTHVGCEHGVCGACTVLMDGDSVRSCLMLAVQVSGAEITTVEGLGTPEALNVLQNSVPRASRPPVRLLHTRHAHDRRGSAPQVSALATDEEIREGLSGNLCRCTGYQNIVAAIRSAVAIRREKAS